MIQSNLYVLAAAALGFAGLHRAYQVAELHASMGGDGAIGWPFLGAETTTMIAFIGAAFLRERRPRIAGTSVIVVGVGLFLVGMVHYPIAQAFVVPTLVAAIAAGVFDLFRGPRKRPLRGRAASS